MTTSPMHSPYGGVFPVAPTVFDKHGALDPVSYTHLTLPTM